MIRVIPLTAAILTMLLFFSACQEIRPRGYLYSHVTMPLTTNFSRTPVAPAKGSGDIKHVHIPYVDADFKWHGNAIGDIAGEKGINTIYFADIETFSILGIWNQYTVHIHGE